MYLKSFLWFARFTTFSAISIAPSPPFAQPSTRLNSTSWFFNSSLINSISSSKSELYLFNATITFNPNSSFILWICFNKLLNPFDRAISSLFNMFSFNAPPWYFKAFIVATITTTSGTNPVFLHLISKNFSAPKSEPNPASVTI